MNYRVFYFPAKNKTEVLNLMFSYRCAVLDMMLAVWDEVSKFCRNFGTYLPVCTTSYNLQCWRGLLVSLKMLLIKSSYFEQREH